MGKWLLPPAANAADSIGDAMIRRPERTRLARSIASAIPNDSSLFLNTCPSAQTIAEALLQHRGLYVITNDLTAATTLTAAPDCQVVVTGGLVRPSDRGIIGDGAIDLIQQFRVDIGVIGARGIDSDGSLFDGDYREVRVVRAIMANSRKVFLVADGSNFDRGGMVRLGTIDEIDAVFIESEPPGAIARTLAKAGITVHVAGAGSICAA